MTVVFYRSQTIRCLLCYVLAIYRYTINTETVIPATPQNMTFTGVFTIDTHEWFLLSVGKIPKTESS